MSRFISRNNKRWRETFLGNNMSEFEAIKLEIGDGIAKITLNRPDAANAMNLILVKELARAALVCNNDKTVKVVLLTAAGRMFSAGGDLKAFSSFGDQTSLKMKELADELHKAVSTFVRMKAVVVIAVNGLAAGAGFSLSLTGDFVIAAASAKFTMAYTGAGLSPDGSSTYFVPRLIGLKKAQELMLTNRTLTATEACDWGLISRVVPDEELQEAALTLARQFAAGPSHAQSIVKKLLLCSLGNGLEEQMEIEGREIADAAATADGKEGILAFVEKRKPNFK
jgi:2-(1,2-epoxy-1,2-dihydrophenyl)acetyl-CoA isomerase